MKAEPQARTRFERASARGYNSMKREIKYTNEPMGKVRVVKDFLPSPDQLAFKENGQRVTLKT